MTSTQPFPKYVRSLVFLYELSPEGKQVITRERPSCEEESILLYPNDILFFCEEGPWYEEKEYGETFISPTLIADFPDAFDIIDISDEDFLELQ